jgi:2-methylfumaryl-CoA hydratase
VLSFTRWVMIKKRSSAETQWRSRPVVPDLPDAIAPTTLWVDDDLVPAPEVSGARWAFGDYSVGETILHHDAMSVNPSDHMALTRLAQNSAKVHFDAHGMQGRPLVYGGVVISHAYALQLNGLERRLGIVGLNAGSHSNPTYAGDTLYAFTEVLDAVPLTAAVGALRLRLVAVKNENPSDAPIEVKVADSSRPGRDLYHPNVVLDLDLWELVGR